MWRSLFIALGIMAIIFGFECLVIDNAVLYSRSETTATSFLDPTSAPADTAREWRPREWLPWTVLSAGTIVVLYAFTLPRRWRNLSIDA
ncbi:MAG: hypothetical protein HKN47_13640 [Pirellulaceae bacterium]|nr:hypothetical protein [Pirellulaceae bacterium]